MNYFFKALGLSSALIASTIFAGTMGPTASDPDCWVWVGTLSGGPLWGDGGGTRTFFLTPDIQKTYYADESNNILFYGEAFLGLEKSWSQSTSSHIGLAVAATSDALLRGIIWDDANPQFDNHTYEYYIQHSHVALKGKLLTDWGWFLPWISGSLGVGFNNAHDFNNAPRIFEALPNPNFADHTETALTYSLGLGVQKNVRPHWQIGVGFEFSDWGRSELGRAEGQTLNTGIPLNHFYTNAVLFNITYLS